MAITVGTEVLTVHLPTAEAQALRNLAAKHGYRTHRLMQKILGYAAQGKLDISALTDASDANLNHVLDSAVSVSLDVRLVARLQFTAMQMRDPSGKASSMSWLARAILMHYTCAQTDIVERIRAEPRADYVNTAVQLIGAGSYYYPGAKTVFTCKVPGRAKDGLVRAAAMRNQSVSKLVTQILDRTLPTYPYLDNLFSS